MLARNFCLLIPILVYEVKRDISPRRRKSQAASRKQINCQLSIEHCFPCSTHVHPSRFQPFFNVLLFGHTLDLSTFHTAFLGTRTLSHKL